MRIRLFSRSKRQNFAYTTLFFAILFSFSGLFIGADLLGIAAIIAAYAGLTLPYIKGETDRPSCVNHEEEVTQYD